MKGFSLAPPKARQRSPRIAPRPPHFDETAIWKQILLATGNHA